jgi:tRNA-2-methylthio-N6-dimethylallyladenosine synthase
MPVLVEGPSKNDPVMLSGRTDDYWVVNFKGDPATPVGSILDVRIESARHHTLRGEAVA